MIKVEQGFVETNCEIELQGRKFSAGGAWLAFNMTNNRWEGMLYGSEKTKELTSWDGTLRIPARFGKRFHCGRARRQYVRFRYNSLEFIGVNGNVDRQQCYRVHSLKPKV